MDHNSIYEGEHQAGSELRLHYLTEYEATGNRKPGDGDAGKEAKRWPKVGGGPMRAGLVGPKWAPAGTTCMALFLIPPTRASHLDQTLHGLPASDLDLDEQQLRMGLPCAGWPSGGMGSPTVPAQSQPLAPWLGPGFGVLPCSGSICATGGKPAVPC